MIGSRTRPDPRLVARRGQSLEEWGQPVATSMFDSFDEDEAMQRPAIVTHPAFPAIVAAWFATLLGLGSLILPPVLLDRLVEITGLASVLPGAAPPLGGTARLLVAVVAAIAGAAIGRAIARRVAAPHEVEDEEPQRLRFPSGVRRPINVRDEFGDEEVFDPHGLPVHDRATSADENSRREDHAFETEDSGMSGFDPVPPIVATTPEAFAEPPPRAVDRGPAPAEQRESVDFSAPSYAPRVEQPECAEPPAAHESRTPETFEEMGLVDLAERLRASIERRREWAARNATALPAELEAAPAEEAAQAMAAYCGRPTAIGGAASPARREVHSDAAAPHDFGAPPARPAASPEPDPAQTDAALRAALANLQRMSGSA